MHGELPIGIRFRVLEFGEALPLAIHPDFGTNYWPTLFVYDNPVYIDSGIACRRTC
ncbi:MAG: hypothetical protein QM784_30295 [Polyangiaceae bacterium]